MIIVLCGPKGSGKDTIADILVANHGFQKDLFADQIKRMVKIAFPLFKDEDLYGPSENRDNQYEAYPFTGRKCFLCDFDLEEKEELIAPDQHAGTKKTFVCTNNRCGEVYPEFITPRLALTTLGTQWGRALYVDIWARAGVDRAAQLKTNVVITDCRFFNEMQVAQQNGAAVVRLMRDPSTLASVITKHESETALREIPLNRFDYVFHNDRVVLEALPRAVQLMYEHVAFYLGARGKKGAHP